MTQAERDNITVNAILPNYFQQLAIPVVIFLPLFPSLLAMNPTEIAKRVYYEQPQTRVDEKNMYCLSSKTAAYLYIFGYGTEGVGRS